MKHPSKSEQQDALVRLREMLHPSDKVNCILRHVSRSGMSREISLLVGDYDISYLAARLLDMNRGKSGGIKIGGCGMDMGFELVYCLGRKLFPDGFKVKGIGRNGDTSGWDKDGGYALKYNWL